MCTLYIIGSLFVFSFNYTMETVDKIGLLPLLCSEISRMNHKNSNPALVWPFILCSLAFLSVFSLPHFSDAAGKKKVLFLNSYHIGYKWSDEIYHGVMSSLKESHETWN